MKQKLFEKNFRIQFLEKQNLKDKAELDAKDRLIDTEVSKSELLQKNLEEAEARPGASPSSLQFLPKEDPQNTNGK